MHGISSILSQSIFMGEIFLFCFLCHYDLLLCFRLRHRIAKRNHARIGLLPISKKKNSFQLCFCFACFFLALFIFFSNTLKVVFISSASITFPEMCPIMYFFTASPHYNLVFFWSKTEIKHSGLKNDGGFLICRYSQVVKWGLVQHLALWSIQRFIAFCESWYTLDPETGWCPLGTLWHFTEMQIYTAITKNHTFDNILKTKNGRAMKSVYIHMFSWSVNTINIKPTF